MKKYIPHVVGFCLALVLSGCASGSVEMGTTPNPTQPKNACVLEAQTRLAQEQRIYRSILLGRPSASARKINDVAYTEDGRAWIKTAEDTWKTTSIDNISSTKSDTEIDAELEWEGKPGQNYPRIRLGIFETKGVLTSELIGDITQSYRALTCRLASVCDGISGPWTIADNGYMTVRSLGCKEFVMKPVISCLGRDDGAANINTCNGMAASILEREGTLLQALVTYDAAFRTHLQFAGNFDMFLENFRGDILEPLRQAASVLGHLSRIPCFISQCNG